MDPVEVRERMQRLAERIKRRDDYGQLLAAGHVIRSLASVADAEQWRAEIRRQARADRLRVLTNRKETRAWATLRDLVGQPSRIGESDRYQAAMRLSVPRAVSLNHEVHILVRDGEEVVCECGWV